MRGRSRPRIGRLEAKVLLYLYRNGGVGYGVRSITEGIYGQLGKRRIEREVAVSRAIRRLAEKGLVKLEAVKRKGPGRRGNRVSLTPYGYARVARLFLGEV